MVSVGVGGASRWSRLAVRMGLFMCSGSESRDERGVNGWEAESACEGGREGEREEGGGRKGQLEDSDRVYHAASVPTGPGSKNSISIMTSLASSLPSIHHLAERSEFNSRWRARPTDEGAWLP